MGGFCFLTPFDFPHMQVSVFFSCVKKKIPSVKILINIRKSVRENPNPCVKIRKKTARETNNTVRENFSQITSVKVV